MKNVIYKYAKRWCEALTVWGGKFAEQMGVGQCKELIIAEVH